MLRSNLPTIKAQSKAVITENVIAENFLCLLHKMRATTLSRRTRIAAPPQIITNNFLDGIQSRILLKQEDLAHLKLLSKRNQGQKCSQALGQVESCSTLPTSKLCYMFLRMQRDFFLIKHSFSAIAELFNNNFNKFDDSWFVFISLVEINTLGALFCQTPKSRPCCDSSIRITCPAFHDPSRYCQDFLFTYCSSASTTSS